MARSATGVVTCWNPAAGVVLPQLFEPPTAAVYGRGFPSLSKEGNLGAEFRGRNYVPAVGTGE